MHSFILSVISTVLFIIIPTHSTSRNQTSGTILFKHDVMKGVSQWLGLQDRYKSLVPISKWTYRAFQSKDFHQMDSIITSILQTNRTNTTQLETLSVLEHKFRYSELYALVRNHNLRKLVRHFDPSIFAEQMDPTLPTVIDIFHALNYHAITLEEYNTLSFPNYSNETAFKAKLLILSCRLRFLWTAHYSLYYFSLVHEYCWDTFASELGIPTLDAIFDREVHSNAQTKQLEDLMSRYGLKIFQKQNQPYQRDKAIRRAASKNTSLAKTFMRWICKIDVLGDIIFDGYGNPNTTPLRNDLMTVFILHLGYQMRHHPEYKDSCVRHLYHPPLDDLLAGFTAHAEHIVSELQSYHFAKGNITTCHELLQICSDLKRAAHGMVPMFRGQHW
eukprot:667074_1